MVCVVVMEREREKEDRRKTDAGFPLASRVYNLGLASSIAMAGKRTREDHVTCSSGSMQACRKGDGRAGQVERMRLT